MQAESSNPYSWALGSSASYRALFAGLNGLLCLLFFLQLDPLAAITASIATLALAYYLSTQHHALLGEACRLQLNKDGLSCLLELEDGSIKAEPLALTSCRWLGSNTLVAVATLTESANRFPAKQRLLLTPDNSSQADRHRLAMYYHSGVAA